MNEFILKYNKFKIYDDKGRVYPLHIDKALFYDVKTHQIEAGEKSKEEQQIVSTEDKKPKEAKFDQSVIESQPEFQELIMLLAHNEDFSLAPFINQIKAEDKTQPGEVKVQAPVETKEQKKAAYARKLKPLAPLIKSILEDVEVKDLDRQYHMKQEQKRNKKNRQNKNNLNNDGD